MISFLQASLLKKKLTETLKDADTDWNLDCGKYDHAAWNGCFIGWLDKFLTGTLISLFSLKLESNSAPEKLMGGNFQAHDMTFMSDQMAR